MAFFATFLPKSGTILPIAQPIVNRSASSPDASLSFQASACKQLVYPLHYHHEYQLSYIASGRGRIMIGNRLHGYKSGDMILLAPEVPHFWTYDDDYFARCGPGESAVLHFPPDFAGEGFFERPEMQPVKQMLVRSKGGLRFRVEPASDIERIIGRMSKAGKPERFVRTIELLFLLAECPLYELLNVTDQLPQPDSRQTGRVNRIWEYIFRHYTGEISLGEVSSYAGMSPTAFSRFFKLHSNKTFIDAIQELRVGRACKLLLETDQNVTEIAFACGYNNMANFNRRFRALTGTTPVRFRAGRGIRDDTGGPSAG